MLSRERAMREALSELEEQRARNYAEEERRRRVLSETDPAAAELLQRRSRTLQDGMRAAFANPAEAAAISKRMARQMEQLNAQLRGALSASGLPEDWLQPVSRCPVCGDSGYVGDLVREPCSCLKRAVLERLCSEEGLQGLTGQNFERFDERVFPDEPIEGQKHTQRAYIRLIRGRCEHYADEFAAGQGKGLLFYGETGTGKTYMLNCVAQRVLSRGFSVVFVSAYKLAAVMRRNQFDGSDAERVGDFLTCDLLCIDDLGSEPLRREETIGGLYHIVSERMNENRALAVSTNCSPQQLYERCGDRVAARLCDPGRMQIYHFIGADVRRNAARFAEAAL